MIASLSEITALATKATTGSCQPYGTAEEMGFACRWLCAHGLPGVHLLAQALAAQRLAEQQTGQREDEHSASTPLQWVRQAHHYRLQGSDSPLTLAPAIAELLVLGRDWPLWLERLHTPLLTLPFIARASARCSAHITLQWCCEPTEDNGGDEALAHDVTLQCIAGETTIYARDLWMERPLGYRLCCQWGPPSIPPQSPPHYAPGQLRAARDHAIARGCQIDTASWQSLHALAHNTYVPDSEQSRLSGAGAGLTDDD